MTERGYTYTEQWRHECEVRHIAAMRTRQQRVDYIEGIERKRGKAAADRIRADVPAAWQAMREGRGTPAPQQGRQGADGSAVHLGVNSEAGGTPPGHGSFLTPAHAGSSDPVMCVDSEARA